MKAAALLLLLGACMTTEQHELLTRVEQRQLRIEERQKHCEQCDAELGAEVRAARADLEASRPGLPPVLIEVAAGAFWSAVGLGFTWLSAKLGLKTVRVGVQAIQRRRRRRSQSAEVSQ